MRVILALSEIKLRESMGITAPVYQSGRCHFFLSEPSMKQLVRLLYKEGRQDEKGAEFWRVEDVLTNEEGIVSAFHLSLVSLTDMEVLAWATR